MTQKPFFPNTSWSKLDAIKDESNEGYLRALNFVIKAYWQPTYRYVISRNHSIDDAADITQDFFTHWIEHGYFQKADSSKGKFRTFLLASLNNFLANYHRYTHARKRYPTNGLISIHSLVSMDSSPFVPKDRHTPESIFEYFWVRGLISRVLDQLQIECSCNDKDAHYRILRSRIVDPILFGEEPTSFKELARRHRLTEIQVGNRLIAARRAFLRLLRDEIGTYANTREEAIEEMESIFSVFV